MALTFTEINSITDDYFAADNRKAVDIYFNTSFFVDYFMNRKKGLWERPNGGERIRVPLMYDEAEGGFFTKGDTLSSDDRTMINAAFFEWKNAYGNGTIYKTDELKNSGEYAEVQLVTTKIETAQKTCRKKIASNIYNAAADTAKEITGARSLTNASATSTTYGNIAQTDLVAADGSYPWKANLTTTSEAISLAVIRTLASSAKIDDGPTGKPTVGMTTETLFNIIAGILQVQQRFTTDADTVKAGFTHLVFEGKILAADDYCPSGYLFLFNENYIGFAIHADGFFVREPWANLITSGIAGRSIKIMWHGNIICSNRKAHAAHSNLS